jgi:uncharacterized membrane protein
MGDPAVRLAVRMLRGKPRALLLSLLAGHRHQGTPCQTVDLFGQLRLSFWIAVAGVIVLYAFFVALAGVSLGQLVGVTIVVGALAAIFILRNLRVARDLANRGGDPDRRRNLNQIRERRGF